MIPILFPANATTFTTNGLGRLSDAVECTVSEERNGPYELFLSYPITGRHYSDIAISRIICAVPADGRAMQPFRIYRMEKPLNGIVSVYAEHISYQLNHIPVMPFTASGCAEALTRMVAFSAQDNPFTTWTDKSVTGNFNLTEPRAFRALLGGTQGSILDVYGKGEYEFDNYVVKLHLNRGIDTGVVLRYGKNITDLTQDENIEATITGVCPFWRDQTSGETVTLPEKAVWSSTAANYPYKRTAVIDFSADFQEAPTVAQLRARANQYITDNDIGIPKVSLDVQFVPLWQMDGVSTGNPTKTLMLPATVDGDTLQNLGGSVSGDTVTLSDAYWDITFDDYKVLERLHLCDTLTVRYDALGVDATAKIVKTVYNVLTDRYDSLEIGDARTSLAEQIVQLDSAVEEANSNLSEQVGMLQRYVDHQTELITGGLGGYVVLNYNASGQPEEILIMDTDDMTTAVNVIRMNKNGIGFSTSGYAGPYTSAWTIDGSFNADFISSGTMMANRIAGGILTDLTGQNTWNLTTGLINFANFAWNATYSSLTADGHLTATNATLSGDITLALSTMYAKLGTFTYTVYHETEGTTSEQTESGLIVSNSGGTTYNAIVPDGAQYAKMYYASDNNDLESHHSRQVHYTSSGGTTWIQQVYEKGYFERRIRAISGSVCRLYYDTDGLAYGGGWSYGSGGQWGSRQISPTPPNIEITASRIAVNKNRTTGSSVNYTPSIWIDATYQKINGKTISFSSSSSRRYKHDIAPLDDDRDPHRLLELEARQFVFNEDFNRLQYRDLRGKTIPGFIAEDVAEIYPSAAIRNPDGEVESWDERRIIPGMLALIQEQQTRLDAQEARIAKLEKLIEEMLK